MASANRRKRKLKKTIAKKSLKKTVILKSNNEILKTVEVPKKDEDNQKDTSEVEIISLVRFVKDTDDGDSFTKLHKHVEYYIKLFSKKYHIAGCDSDEIEQECLFALRYKAVEDFNPDRGKFRSFAVLCIRRHLFSLIKGNNQLKRKALNTSISLNQDRSEDGETLSLASLVIENKLSADEEMMKHENSELKQSKLFSKLSKLEREVLKLYLQQLSYEEIVIELKKVFPGKKILCKTIDNALLRCRSKSQTISTTIDWNEK